jgi:hypothetical protein
MPVALKSVGPLGTIVPYAPRCLSAAQNRRRYRVASRGLGALSPEQATEQIFPSSKITNTAGHNQAVYNAILASASAGQILDNGGQPAYVPGSADCAASGVGTAQVALSSVAATAAKTAPFLGPAAPAVAIGAAIVGLFGTIFGHHAAAVKKEQNVLCTAVPAANNYLQLIQQAVSTGQSTPQQGIDALNSLVADFTSAVSSVASGQGPAQSGGCNAGCVVIAELKAIVAMMASQFQDMAAQQQAASSSVSAAGGAASSAGLPTWAIYAAVGAAALLLLSR